MDKFPLIWAGNPDFLLLGNRGSPVKAAAEGLSPTAVVPG